MSTENKVKLVGIITEIQNEIIYTDKDYVRISLKIPRFSENFDEVLVIAERSFLGAIKINDKICVKGTIRTKDYRENDKKHVFVFAYADEIINLSEDEYNSCKQHNSVILSGFICRDTNFRRTNSGRIISDIMLAFNRDLLVKDEENGYKKYHESYYIPCVAWGVGAKKASKLKVGESILIKGRFQSRKYRKKDTLPGDFLTAYEVSIISFEKEA